FSPYIFHKLLLILLICLPELTFPAILANDYTSGSVYLIIKQEVGPAMAYYTSFADYNTFNVLYGRGRSLPSDPLFSEERMDHYTIYTDHVSYKEMLVIENKTEIALQSGYSFTEDGHVRVIFKASHVFSSNSSIVSYDVYCYDFDSKRKVSSTYHLLNISKYFYNYWTASVFRLPSSIHTNNETIFFMSFSTSTNDTTHLWVLHINENERRSKRYVLPVDIIDPSLYTVYLEDLDAYLLIMSVSGGQLCYAYYFPANETLTNMKKFDFSPAIMYFHNAPSQLLYDDVTHNIYLLVLYGNENGRFLLYWFNTTSANFELVNAYSQLLVPRVKNINGLFYDSILYGPNLYYDAYIDSGVLHILTVACVPYSEIEYKVYELMYTFSKGTWELNELSLLGTINPLIATYFYNISSQSYIDGVYNIFGTYSDPKYPLKTKSDEPSANPFLTCMYLYGKNLTFEPLLLDYSFPSSPLLWILTGTILSSIFVVTVVFLVRKRYLKLKG
ncbi:MAG: hypothetical protein ACTSYN_04425, partial [Candidatus Heimdallarchaeaceae archaeon]